MGNKILKYEGDGGDVFIEAEAPTKASGFISADNSVIAKTTDSFAKTLEPAVNFAQTVIAKITEFQVNKPTNVEIEFGLKFSAEAKFWVVSANGEGSINLKIGWDNKS